MKYEIIGENMQGLKVTFDPGESIFADAGKLVSKQNVKMVPRLKGGIINAMEREITGASAFVTDFEPLDNNATVTLAGTIPGKIFSVELEENEAFVAERFAFVAAQDTVKFSIKTVNISAALFGGAGFILQRFIGPGVVFLHVAGNIIKYDMDGSSPIEIDPRHIAGFSDSLKYEITFVDNIRSALFAGVGVFLAKFEGSGTLVAHSVSRYKLASELCSIGQQQRVKGPNS